MRRKSEHANKGMGLETEIEYANKQYAAKGLALIQKIPTPVKVLKQTGNRVQGFWEKKSTLDFRGTVKGGISISFDAKEVSTSDKGLPLSYIAEHQITHIRSALTVGEVSFILCHIKKADKRYFAPGNIILAYWDWWQENKGKRGCKCIPVEAMIEVRSGNGVVLDYLRVVKGGE